MSAPSAPSAARVERSFLSFDYGLRRVGVASGNTLLGQARPLRTLSSEGQARFDEIAALVAQWQPDALVVGVPFHPDGAPHENTARARRFARQLAGRLGLPVHEVDERYSTVEVLSEGAHDVDAAAAAVILQQFLDAQERPSSAHDGAPGEDHPGSLEGHPQDPPSLEHRP